MSNQSLAQKAAEQIKQRYPQYKPKIGIILGSGLGAFADTLENSVVIPYSELPGFPNGSVHGHAARLVLGTSSGVDVVCLQGRAHGYEGDHNHAIVKNYVRTLKLLGCEYFIATNAAGSMRKEIPPGELVLITDHINFQATNPLIGPNDEEFGPRFYPLDNAYHRDVRQQLLDLAAQADIPLHQGIYLAVLGPHYETAAEIRAFQILGADVVGMSTVPEVLVANHCGMKVGVISIMSNYATGLSHTPHSHDEVVRMASSAAVRLNELLKRFVAQLSTDHRVTIDRVT